MTEPITPLLEAPYIMGNWKKLLATSMLPKMIQVSHGTASITNGRVLIRSPLRLPDGFFIIHDNHFEKLSPSDVNGEWRRFPNIDAIRPNFENLETSAWLLKEEAATVLSFLEEITPKESILQRKRVTVFLDRNGITTAREPSLTYAFPCPMPVNTDRVYFDADDLMLAFTEMLRYDTFLVGADKEESYSTPLVLGTSWESCALIVSDNTGRWRT